MSAKEINDALYGRRSKFNVDQSAKGKEARTYDGITFHSKHEMEVYRDWVKPQVAIGIFHALRFQVRFDLHARTPGGFEVKVGTYVADFTVLDRENKLHVIDAKGCVTPVYKLKRNIFEAEYGIRITEL
jgi:hypothetical protein